jgi:hypothetical protein
LSIFGFNLIEADFDKVGDFRAGRLHLFDDRVLCVFLIGALGTIVDVVIDGCQCCCGGFLDLSEEGGFCCRLNAGEGFNFVGGDAGVSI